MANILRILTVLVALCVAVALSACGVFTPDQAAAIESTVRAAYVAGDITRAQYDAAIEALRQQTGPDWELIAAIGGNVLLTILGVPIYLRRTSTRAQLEKMGTTLPEIVAATKKAEA